jgi:zeta-carotene desaturase
MGHPDAVVIGAGCAGLSAAVRLADRGWRVVVVEEAPRLGGRATAFTDRETGERVDNGQHVLFGCYRETYRFLKTIGAEELAPLQPRLRLTLAAPDGRSSTLTCPPLPPPWHLVGGVLRWRALSFKDRFTAIRMRRFIDRARRYGAERAAAEVPASQTVRQWLTTHGQSHRLCEWLWDPLAFAALNQAPEVASARPFARVIGELFGPRVDDSAVGLPRVPLDELFAEPARQYLEARGGAIRSRSSARVVINEAGRVRGVRIGDEIIEAHAIVSAVPWHAFSRLWERGVPSALLAVAAGAATMSGAPIVTVNLWIDGAVIGAPFVGLVGGPMHWVFDKSAIVGGAAGHLSVVASGATGFDGLDNQAITDAALQQLRDALPGLRGRSVRRSVVVREPRATFSLAPGGAARPGSRTALHGFYLAGDWTDTGLPATIEGAVLSGHRAADAALSDLPLPR